jgi:molecular chaperone GrpE
MQEENKDLKCNGEDGNSDGEAEEGAAADETEALKGQIADLEDRLLRAIADSQNEQKRAEKERVDIARYGIAEFARDVLTIRDNLKLALGSDTGSESAIMDGIKLTLAEMDKILARYKITEIKALNTKFDPHFHQAMIEIEDKENEPGTVVQVMQDGFTIHERLLRPALVGISKK